jgi:YfiH family protein
MFFQDDANVYHSDLLGTVPWVVHGFGTRNSYGWPGEYIRAKQIHSDFILIADGESGCIGQGDALVRSAAGHLIGVRTADCVPILMADSTSSIVAAVHAGWRGSAADIAGKTVRRLSDFKAKSDHLLVAIGPCIGECCFEVGPELEPHFAPLFPEKTDFRRIDLAEANRRQLIAAGVRPENIDVSGLCTRCGAEEFHSFRRDREASGRMVAAIGITKPAP